MCGIAGIVDSAGRLGPVALGEAAAAMARHLSHRGPDGHGLWVDPSGACALSHQRLAVVDLSENGRQPMSTADGETTLTFNGEIYNYRDLRRELVAEGVSFRTESDTEVLLHHLQRTGVAGLGVVRGMFAFAAWSSGRRELLLARDAFGKKPLYFTEVQGLFAFASELDAFAALPGFAARIDVSAVAEYLLLKHIGAPRSVYEGCRKVPGGGWMRVDFSSGRARSTTGRHFTFRARPVGADKPGSDSGDESAVEELRGRIVQATATRLHADVRVGAFLSGGVDSALVAAVVRRELGQPLSTFTLGYAASPSSEHLPAQYVADALGTRHTTHLVDADHLERLPSIAMALDEPNGDTSCLPTYLLSAGVRPHVTVALTGDGGDELFGGYERYLSVPPASGVPPAVAYISRLFVFSPPMVGALLPDSVGPLSSRLEEWSQQFLAGDAAWPCRARELDVQLTMPCWLAKADRMSMRFALEIRSPLLDRDVADFAATLVPSWCGGGGVAKSLLRRVARRYFSDEYLDRPKSGFGIPADGDFRGRLVDRCRAEVLRPNGGVARLVRCEALVDVVSSPRLTISQAWSLLILEYWLRGRGWSDIRSEGLP
jgi:asparagine synthase (glutamine-hydrolysing)